MVLYRVTAAAVCQPTNSPVASEAKWPDNALVVSYRHWVERLVTARSSATLQEQSLLISATLSYLESRYKLS